MLGHYFTIEDNRLRFSGVSFGYGDSDPVLIARKGDLFLVRTPSTRNWSSQGQTSTYPATWCLLRATPNVEHPEARARKDLKVREMLAEVTPGRKWKKAKEELLAMMEKLST